jgi:hypothetical protein
MTFTACYSDSFTFNIIIDIIIKGKYFKSYYDFSLHSIHPVLFYLIRKYDEIAWLYFTQKLRHESRNNT